MDQKFNELFQKYTAHIESHYGYNIQWSPHLPVHKEIAFNYVDGEHLVFFPIKYKNRIVGSAHLTSKTVVSKNKADHISDMVDLLFGPTIDSLERFKHLSRLEENMLLQNKPSNLIPFRRPQTKQKNHSHFSSYNKKPQLYTPILIQGPNDKDISRIALEIHYALDRCAFIHYSDLDLATRIQVKELQTLGPISLFVPSILELSRTEQHTLIDLCKLSGTRETPLIISGTTSTYEHLINKTDPIQSLTKALSETYLRMNKNFSEYKKQGVLPFIYENLTKPLTDLDS